MEVTPSHICGMSCKLLPLMLSYDISVNSKSAVFSSTPRERTAGSLLQPGSSKTNRTALEFSTSVQL